MATERKPPRTQAASELLVWVEQRIPLAKRKGCGKTTLEQVLWFFAYNEADVVLDSSRTKDIAYMLIQGFPPMKTLQHLADAMSNYGCDDEEDAPDIQAELKEFFS